MALYRFLFAPVLLAIAVLLGPRGRPPPPAPAAPAAEAQRAAAAAASAVPTGSAAGIPTTPMR